MPEILGNTLGIIENWSRWSEMVAIKLLYIMSWLITFEKILSIRVWEWLLIRIGCKIKDINELEARKSKNSFAWSNYAHYNSRG